MPFELAGTIPWGRSFDEYTAMFALTEADLARRILGCADGPASFNARLTQRGGRVVSLDPLYAFGAEQIRRRILDVAPVVMEQVCRNVDDFVWDTIPSPQALHNVRLTAMEEFLADYARDGAGERYVAAGLPALPLAGDAFELALCSHFLFLYSAQQSFEFHVESIVELCRVALEARIFPLLELGGARSRHLAGVAETLQRRGYGVRVTKVDYEFQRGGDEMLVVSRRT